MSDYVEFKGLKHYPLGDAILTLENESLKVSDFGSDGQNGYMVKFGKLKRINTKYGSYEFAENTHINYKIITSLEDGDAFTGGELSFYKEDDKIYMAGNNIGDVSKIIAKAYLNGEVVKEWNPLDDQKKSLAALPWWVVAYVAYHTTLYHERTEKEIEGGKKVRNEVGANWRGKESIVQDNEGDEFKADRVTITYEFEIENSVDNTSLELRASNLDFIEIDDYEK